MKGAVFFREAMKAVLTMISNIRATARAAQVLHNFGLPAIKAPDEMLV